MRKCWPGILLLSAVPALGQLESHTLTISATRRVNIQPDEVVFGLSVSSATATSLDQVVAALSGLGITSANLTGVGNNNDPKTVQWSFRLATPLSSLSATIASLAKLKQTIGQNNSGLTLTFSLDGTQVSPQLQQSQTCSTSDLIADATAQAQKVAVAAGLVLGPILKLSNEPLIQPYGAPVSGARLGVFAIASFSLAPAPPPVTCTLAVQFQLQL
jgi:uncharacterized protein YggE